MWIQIDGRLQSEETERMWTAALTVKKTITDSELKASLAIPIGHPKAVIIMKQTCGAQDRIHNRLSWPSGSRSNFARQRFRGRRDARALLGRSYSRPCLAQ